MKKAALTTSEDEKEKTFFIRFSEPLPAWIDIAEIKIEFIRELRRDDGQKRRR